MKINEFNNACYEVLQILKNIKQEDLMKIPKEEIQILKSCANYNHQCTYNPNESVKEQKISKMAKGILAVYFEKYIATEKQKEKIRRKRQYDFERIEQEKRERYNTDNIFKNNEKLQV